MRQAQREVPRFSRRHRAQRAAAARRIAGHVPATTAPAAMPAAPVLVRRRLLFRHRHQLIAVGWAVSVLLAGLGTHHARSVPLALLASLVMPVPFWALVRHLEKAPLVPASLMLILTAAWVPALAAAGLAAPAAPLYLTTWVIPAAWWCRHYRVRPGEAQDEQPGQQETDAQLWAATLGKQGRLAGSALCLPAPIPNGAQYTLRLVRGQQDTGDVFAASKKIASLFGKPVTEVYPERFPDGREHEVRLTRLTSNTLSRTVRWDGETIDAETGLAVIGDYPDGTPAHFRFWSPRNGAEQSVVVGVKGGGKSYLLHLLLSIAVSSPVPVIPIVLDPQQGQSLPDWRGRVPYARGIAECALYLRAIDAGMTARSEHLSGLAWTDDEGYERPGMDFYDPLVSGLPLIFPVFDEAHLVLGDPRLGSDAVRTVGNLAKLNRKAGGHLMLVSHTLLLSQLGDMTLRAMLVGGNAVCLRTGENLSGGIIGLEADPKLLPRIFPDGTETQGLGYLVGPDGRPDSPMRARLVPNPRKVAVNASIAEMDPVFGAAFNRVLEQGSREGKPRTVSLPPSLPAPRPAEDAPDDDAPGRTAADAVLTVLEGGAEMSRGQIIQAASALVTGPEWGREKAFAVKSIQNALTALSADGTITKPADGRYRLPAGASAA